MVTTARANKLTRRNFLAWVWGALLVGLLGQGLTALFHFFKPRVESGGFGGVVVVGELEEFEPGTMSYVQKGRVYISRLEDGGVLALWQKCTHLGCTVPWREDLGEFHCPCHSSLFDRHGTVMDGPAPRPLDLFPVRVEEGKLVVDTSRPTERAAFHSSQVFHPG